ncbi:MAG: 4Fe-4S binding protein, partial [Candidatus Saccharimonadales bacterium]
MPEAAQSAVLSLSRLRLGVQLLMLALTVWGGALVGHYAAEKISNALPSLSCAYDQSNGAYCVLIPLQHQMHHRVGELIQQTGKFTLSLLLPLVFTVAAFYAFYFFIGKAFCGWICPLGTVQEGLYRLGRLLRRPFRHLSERAARRLRPLKWLVLLVLVLGLPLAAG